MVAPRTLRTPRMIHEIIPVGWLQCNCSILGDPVRKRPHFCGERKKWATLRIELSV